MPGRPSAAPRAVGPGLPPLHGARAAALVLRMTDAGRRISSSL